MPNHAHGIALPESATATAAAAGLTRKSAGRAMSSVEHNPRVAGNKRGRPASGKKLSEVIESTTLFWGFTRDPKIRAKVRSQVRRLRRDPRRRYDPCLVEGIIAKRVHVPERVVREILQGSIPEFEEWMAEVRAGMVRVLAAADEKAAAIWLRKSA